MPEMLESWEPGRRVLAGGRPLERAEAAALLDELLRGLAGTAEREAGLRLAALLAALAGRGVRAEELAGFAETLRERGVVVALSEAERGALVDTCGTGGDGGTTFNISTGAALVAAAAGATVAKHGNRAITSRCGSADVLESLGIRVDHTPESAAAALRTHRFAFFAAPSFHPALRAAAPVRRALGVRTVFNVLGPMVNPAGARRGVLGVYAPELVPVVAEALRLVGAEHTFVVHGGGLDEFTLEAETSFAEVRGGTVRFGTVGAESFGLARAPVEVLAGGDAAENARILLAISAGERGPRRDAVVMNAGAVLVAAGLAEDFSSGARLAESTIDANAVTELLHKLTASAKESNEWHV